MRRYGHLSVAERDRVAGMRVAGAGVGEIAREVGRSASTVSREHARNGPGAVTAPSPPSGPASSAGSPAGRAASSTTWSWPRGVRSPLSEGCWSPEQVDGRLRLEVGRCVVSLSPIYRAVARGDLDLPGAEPVRRRLRRGAGGPDAGATRRAAGSTPSTSWPSVPRRPGRGCAWATGRRTPLSGRAAPARSPWLTASPRCSWAAGARRGGRRPGRRAAGPPGRDGDAGPRQGVRQQRRGRRAPRRRPVLLLPGAPPLGERHQREHQRPGPRVLHQGDRLLEGSRRGGGEGIRPHQRQAEEGAWIQGGQRGLLGDVALSLTIRSH